MIVIDLKRGFCGVSDPPGNDGSDENWCSIGIVNFAQAGTKVILLERHVMFAGKRVHPEVPIRFHCPNVFAAKCAEYSCVWPDRH